MSAIKIVGAYDPVEWYGAVTIDGRTVEPAASLAVVRHSPDGFAWGYHGSGPAQLALAILLAAGVEKDVAIILHQDFKGAFIAKLPQDAGFELTVDVDAWLADRLEVLSRCTGCGRLLRYRHRHMIPPVEVDATYSEGGLCLACLEAAEEARG